MGKRYGEKIIADVLERKKAGETHREKAGSHGLSKVQIKGLLKRYRQNQAKLAAGNERKPKGRPRTRNLTKEQEMKLQIKRLEREVALYKSFLQAAGRM